MSWPLASQFSAMLQNPKVAFRDPALQQCRIEKDRRNQPRPWSGAFAVVYKGIRADDGAAFAVRVFTTESPERRERYDLISEYLSTRRVNCLVDFEYRDRSIRSAGDGKWYPLIVMDWVEGDTLFTWARDRSLEGNTEALAAAASRWLAVVKELDEAGIGHGDLQHANVMVTTSGELKLVDYDCMCVPALVGRRNLEVGVEPYQHPERNETTHLSPDLDNFSALVIYVALRALAADPSLWVRYVQKPAHDKLLFHVEDFRTPYVSLLYEELTNSPDRDVRELAEQLFAFWTAPMDQVPRLAYVTNSYAKVEELLAGQRWEEAVALLNRRGRFRDAPAHLKPLIHQAYEHVCRQQAWARFQKIPLEPSQENDRCLVDAWNEALFAGFEPAERLRNRVAQARRNLAVLDRLGVLVGQASQSPTFARQWNVASTAKQLPAGYRHTLEPHVQRARQCVEAIEAIERAVRLLDDDVEIVAAWRRVVQAHCERLVDVHHRGRIERAQKRLAVLRALRELKGDCPADKLDRRLLDLWREELSAGCEELAAWRPAYEQAVRRKQLLARMEEAISRRDEPAVARLLDEPDLNDYPLPPTWMPAVCAAYEQVRKADALLAALDEGQRESFLQLFDARLIRGFVERFTPCEALLEEWVRADILPLEKLGLRPALGRIGLHCLDAAAGTFRVRWTWPQHRFSDQCILAVCSQEPAAGEDPQEITALHRVRLDRESWESNAGSSVIHLIPDWIGSHVVVWAIVDVGFSALYSDPLVLGRLDTTATRSTRSKRKWHILPGLGSRPRESLEPSADLRQGPHREDERG